jgi:hypothetical protein
MDGKKKTSRDIEKNRTLELGTKNDRHNDNAGAEAALEQETPRINTDNL